MAPTARRCTDHPDSNFDHRRLRNGYPCIAHGEWLQKLDDRMWAILLAVCGGALASVITLLVMLMKRGG